MKVVGSLPAPVDRPPRLRGAARIAIAVCGLAACTGRVPGTGVPSTVPPGVVYETARARQSPLADSAEPDWLDSPPPAAPAAPLAPAPYIQPPAPPRPATHVAAPAAAAPAAAPYAYGPSGTRRDSAGGDGPGRERQIAILTEAVTALREEIARGYAHSQELLEETKRLRIQVRTLREDLEKSQNANAALRAQVRTLERRLGEIRVSPPVE